MSPPPAHSYNSADTLPLRQALGEYATGVTVITARGRDKRDESDQRDESGADGPLVGLTVNSFASVSLDPPLVLWSLGMGSASREAFRNASHFAVNVLAADQIDLSKRFSQPHGDRFAGIDWKVGAGGTALLSGCCAWFECRVETQHEGGDHIIFIGRVEQFRRGTAPPLVFHRGGYTELLSRG